MVTALLLLAALAASPAPTPAATAPARDAHARDAHARDARSRVAYSRIAPARTLLWAIDGLSFEAFTEARTRGLFRRFQFAGRHVAPYPSMSHPSWTELTGARRIFGERANIRTVEARWFDLDAMRVADDPRQVFARQAAPFNYMRAFDWFADPLSEPLMYFKGDALPDKELADAERDVLEHFTGTQYTVFIGGVDAIAHTQRGVLFGYLRRLDAMMTRVIDSLDHRGGAPVHHVIVSDHGNAGRFVEGAAESYLTPVSLTKAFRTARLVRRDTGALTAPNQAAVVTIALASMVNVYFADLTRRRVFAEAAVQDSAVDLVTWLEVLPNDRYITVLSRTGGESRIRFGYTGTGGLVYSVEAVRGNPLAIPEAWFSTPGAVRLLNDSITGVGMAASRYPDALGRLVRSATKEIENAPDLIVNLRDGFAFDGHFGRYVRMVRTHGALGARASFGLVATTYTPVPAALRSSDVLAAVGLTPDSLYRRILSRVPREARALADSLAAAPARLGTGRDDEGTDASFLRRVAPIVQSAGYFDASTLRALFASAQPDSASRAVQRRTLRRSREALAASDVVKGVTTHVDALWRLTDSLPRGDAATSNTLRTLADRTERQLRAIPELAPLATLRSLWTRPGDSVARGRGEPLRRAAMAAWTLPYFVSAVLDAPERDSIDDPRDRTFAQRWHSGARDSVRAMPTLLFRDSTRAARLFTQVFAERQLLRQVQSSDVPLLYNTPLGDTPDRDLTVLYVPGIFGELFDDEIWQRGLRALHDQLGLRIVQAGTDGRCSAADNATRILEAMREDSARRVARGYRTPRYLLIGYSKGGVDAAEALTRDPQFAGAHVAGLVTIASPHGGSPVAERTDLPDELLRTVITRPRPVRCDTSHAVESLWPANRAAFWNGAGKTLEELVPLASVSLASELRDAHPWMKITKRIARFAESNDGVVARSASRFPESVPAIDLGEVVGDHIAGRVASDFPQEAFLEAVVLTLNELGWFTNTGKERWLMAARQLRRDAHRAESASSASTTGADNGTLAGPRAPPVREPRASFALPGHIGWRADRTYKMTNLEALADREIPLVTRAAYPDGVTLWCDQRDMTAFREEYEFLYDAGNGGGENTLDNGFAIVDADSTARGRACRLRTHRSAMKMTTASLRFRPTELSQLELRLRVQQGVRGVAPNKGGRGRNDAALKLWIVLRDERPGAGGKPLLFGYTWAAPDADGAVPAADSLVEASASRRRIGFSTLPEAWLVYVGGPPLEGRWVDLSRNLARDIARAFPGVPLEALRVAAVTIQTDSDDSRGDTEVLLERLTFRPAPP